MSDTMTVLREAVRGRVIAPSDPDYDDARLVYNGMHDRKPLAVIRCMDSADVMATVAAARDDGLDLAIRGGGHSVPGFGTVDDGLVIDLSRMNQRACRPGQEGRLGWRRRNVGRCRPCDLPLRTGCTRRGGVDYGSGWADLGWWHRLLDP